MKARLVCGACLDLWMCSEHLQLGRDKVMASSGGIAIVSHLHTAGMLMVIDKWHEVSGYGRVITSATQTSQVKQKKKEEGGHLCYNSLHPCGSWKTHILIPGISSHPAWGASFSKSKVCPLSFGWKFVFRRAWTDWLFFYIYSWPNSNYLRQAALKKRVQWEWLWRTQKICAPFPHRCGRGNGNTACLRPELF